MRGCEMGGQSERRDKEDNLARLDPDNENEDREENEPDDDEWKEWRVDDPDSQPDYDGDWDEDGEPFTPSDHSHW